MIVRGFVVKTQFQKIHLHIMILKIIERGLQHRQVLNPVKLLFYTDLIVTEELEIDYIWCHGVTCLWPSVVICLDIVGKKRDFHEHCLQSYRNKISAFVHSHYTNIFLAYFIDPVYKNLDAVRRFLRSIYIHIS